MIDKLRGAWRSWTIHFNVWCGIVLSGLPLAQDSFPQLQPYLPANLFQKAMVVLIVGNLLLRFKTDSDLAHK